MSEPGSACNIMQFLSAIMRFVYRIVYSTAQRILYTILCKIQVTGGMVEEGEGGWGGGGLMEMIQIGKVSLSDIRVFGYSLLYTAVYCTEHYTAL